MSGIGVVGNIVERASASNAASALLGSTGDLRNLQYMLKSAGDGLLSVSGLEAAERMARNTASIDNIRQGASVLRDVDPSFGQLTSELDRIAFNLPDIANDVRLAAARSRPHPLGLVALTATDRATFASHYKSVGDGVKAADTAQKLLAQLGGVSA